MFVTMIDYHVCAAECLTLHFHFLKKTFQLLTVFQNNMYCFPPSLAWIVSQLYHALTKTQVTTSEQARAICADLVMASFICPAVCDPEPYGITSDAPIGYIARHNLIQVLEA